ncbi:type II toxin-antitoxin system RelE/ParE family toxin [Polynucleobacter sp. 86C-FISCH]|uniref:type II toxin-antitoxin system RelE/ParE family toxin n=1 Tax=Polynucleobacter sp. 86C-FISCH TaxID=2689101 RepID=UPI001C0CB7F2|nr:type II toxin-antitoxin system RelE/ParE family toxin [Polynucleobacter sp. 86C-FISCH]MBU3594927.1 type II toxin-antitoxin system RelE/ParE family toxin [Polynucleobacter sp. 86C-FISCH]
MTEWIVETLNTDVDKELETLPSDIRSRIVRVCNLLEAFGPRQVGMPHIKSLGDKLWEIRASGRDGIARGIYIYATGKRIVLLHAFIKKSQKTPPQAILTATQRAKSAKLL